MALRRTVTTNTILFAWAEYGLARSLAALDRDRDRAVALASAALTSFERHGPGAAANVENPKALLRALDRPAK
jgi:hypothetical protein